MMRIEITNKEEVLERLRGEKEPGTKLRLILLNLIGNHNIRVEKACEITGTPLRTAYDWISKWNEHGYDEIRDSSKGGGRPPKLGEKDILKLEESLREQSYWTTQEARRLVNDKWGIELSQSQVRRILRDKLGMGFSKPYALDYRRPSNAEEILAGNLDTVISLLKEGGIKEEEVAIGFLDETSPQLTANTVRVWSFGKVKILKNTAKMRANTIGFYAIRGKSVHDFLEDSRAESIARFMEKVRQGNSGYKAVIAIMDNFKSHTSSLVRERAKELGLYIVHLPPYSPDLNPIEFIWKSIKRVVSLSFVRVLEDLKCIISEKFEEFSSKLSYAGGWIKRFFAGRDICNGLCN
ncbi:IS630 family transposase [Dehalococcoidia bacterium]|nr:IS630 family transposase [Dehalococcoidia bacterium]MCL0081898.1 IS630 family transposase [Dehalococcoidia bacterium]